MSREVAPAEEAVESPKKGPTLSTSTSSFEALDPHDPKLNQLAISMFDKTKDYLQGELNGTLEEYTLLENMNRITLAKYTNMKEVAVNVAKNVEIINDKYNTLLPYLQQIDEIEQNLIKMEQAAYKLDAYSKKLEAKFKSLEKR